MYKQEQVKPYNAEESKGQQVEQMFDHIAHSYDKLNHRLSWDIDRLWRKKAIKQLAESRPQQLLDIATGTGDLAILAAETLKPKRIVGADLSEEMMKIARQKAEQRGLSQVMTFQREDCMSLSFQDNSFDAVTAAFGIRNFENLDQGLREMHRVLRPDGRLCIIELTTPVSFPMKQLFRIYSHTVLPLYGKMVSKDSRAYQYLIQTIEAFPQGERMMQILADAGFSDATFRRMTFGICTMYLAKK